MTTTRTTGSITSVSWIPSEGVPGAMKAAFATDALHYDAPPPAHLGEGDLAELHAAGGFRAANALHAWIDVTDGAITGYGQSGQGWISSTDLDLGPRTMTFAPGGLPDIRPEPEVGDGWVRFRQTAGGRSGIAAPRRTGKAPFFGVKAPVIWTELELTLHADGRRTSRVVSASGFPRHWIYDDAGDLQAKSGQLRFRDWYHGAVEDRSPWGEDTGDKVRELGAPLVAPVESPEEHALADQIMAGDHIVEKVRAGDALVSQGAAGGEVYLVLDGILRVEVDGRGVGEIGPGAVVGERGPLEANARTATLRAVTNAKVAMTAAAIVGGDALSTVVEHHQRELA